jgi:hypothetical protein
VIDLMTEIGPRDGPDLLHSIPNPRCKEVQYERQIGASSDRGPKPP